MDQRNKRLNEVLAPATKGEIVANFQPVPEPRHGGGEFKRNIIARRLRHSHNGYDGALLRLAVSLVRYQYSLAGLYTTCHRDQSASSTDGDCVGLFVERIATYAVDGQREMDVNPTRYAIRVIATRSFSDFGLLAFEAPKIGVNLRSRLRQVYWPNEQFRDRGLSSHFGRYTHSSVRILKTSEPVTGQSP